MNRILFHSRKPSEAWEYVIKEVLTLEQLEKVRDKFEFWLSHDNGLILKIIEEGVDGAILQLYKNHEWALDAVIDMREICILLPIIREEIIQRKKSQKDKEPRSKEKKILKSERKYTKEPISLEDIKILTDGKYKCRLYKDEFRQLKLLLHDWTKRKDITRLLGTPKNVIDAYFYILRKEGKLLERYVERGKRTKEYKIKTVAGEIAYTVHKKLGNSIKVEVIK